MKFEDFWQENKRFVLIVIGGAVALSIGWGAIQSTLGDELAAQEARLRTLDGKLAEAKFTEADQQAAQVERDRLAAEVEKLSRAAKFRGRPEFALDGGSPSSRYFAIAARTREDLFTLAGRSGLTLPEGLGLPALSPTKEQEIARYLAALDLIDRTLRLSVEAGIERVEELRIKLDPRLLSGKSIPDIERTLVEFEMVGPSAPMTRLLLLLQQDRGHGVALVERASIKSSLTRQDEAKLELTLLIAELGESAPLGEPAVEERRP